MCEVLDLDKKNGNSLWHDAIQKELKNAQVAFLFLFDDYIVPIRYNQIPCHIIFGIKMDLSCKARIATGGHKTDPPSTLSFKSVVSCDSIHIVFLIAA